MVNNLQELKNEQQELRTQLILIYSNSKLSITALSKKMDVPYTTLRSFMMGEDVCCKNIFKVKYFLDQQ